MKKARFLSLSSLSLLLLSACGSSYELILPLGDGMKANGSVMVSLYFADVWKSDEKETITYKYSYEEEAEFSDVYCLSITFDDPYGSNKTLYRIDTAKKEAIQQGRMGIIGFKDIASHFPTTLEGESKSFYFVFQREESDSSDLRYYTVDEERYTFDGTTLRIQDGD